VRRRALRPGTPRRAGTRLLAVALLVVSAAATTGCGSGGEKKSAPLPEAFCRAAEAFDSKMTASRKPPVREQVRLVEAMARTAPPDIRDDARAFLTAMRRVEKDPHDPRAFDNAEVQKAVDDVNRRVQNGCPFFQQGDSGI